MGQITTRFNAEKTDDCNGVKQSQQSAPTRTTITINSRQYELGEMLGKGGFGIVYEGRRVEDDLKVAVKLVGKCKKVKYICIPDHPKPIPMEIALHILANKEPRAPEIIQLLDWEDQRDRYVMVLEDFSPCMDMFQYLRRNGGKVDEDLAKVVMWKATMAVFECFKRGVFHRDIKLDNLLITNKLQVKLIDFGCGDLLKKPSYKNFVGTLDYFCPEYFKTGKYHAEQATVYSLGVTLFLLVCGKRPRSNDRCMINNNLFYMNGLSKECCQLIQACMQKNPERRIRLDQIFKHRWFQDIFKDHKVPRPPVRSVSVDIGSLSKMKLKNNKDVTNKGVCEYPFKYFPEGDRREGQNTIETIEKITRDYRSSSSDANLS